MPNATYRNHGSLAEAIEIEIDSKRISYRDLLEIFLRIHDPTTLNRQGNADIAAIVINMNLGTRLKLAQGAVPVTG